MMLIQLSRAIRVLLVSGALAVALVGVAAPAHAGDPFVPNDPYYSLQWHLDKQATGAVVDANVAGAWADGWTGQGVRIGIVEGNVFEFSHPDLAPNYTSQFDFYEENQSRQYYTQDHPTSVAGIAAARGGNGIGVTGAAPYADVSSLSVNANAVLYDDGTLVEDVPACDASLGRATLHRNDAIQIKSYSLSVVNQFADMPMVTQALHDSANSRTINVFAAANGRANANKYGDKNHAEQIVVGAVGSNGIYSDYSNYGANLTVCAPSNTSGGLGITTTDRVGTAGYNGGPTADYTSVFGGTSAATPLVSGILALAKEAQPNLDTRFTKHLLALTSAMIDPGENTSIRRPEVAALLSDPNTVTPVGGWHTNAAGIHFNNMYGFGMINAEALCDAAQQYSGVTPLVTEATGAILVGSAVPEDGSLSRTFTLGDSGHIEDLSFDFSLTGMFKASVEMLITSPSGTQSLIQDGYIASSSNTGTSGTRDWTYLTNAFWGEDSSGTWTVTIRDLPWNNPNEVADQVMWNSFGITANFGDLIAVPEPSTLAFLAIAGVVLLCRQCRRAGEGSRSRTRTW
jgi:subtilisin family serine protease